MSFGDHDDDDIPMENLQPPPGYRGRRTSSMHLDVAELTLLSANSGSWIAQESLHHNTDLDNEYYHRISEAPFRKRFANFSDYSMGTSGKHQVPGNKRGFYSGQQTAYFVDDHVSDDNAIGEYTRPSLYQLMKHYQPKHRPIPMTTGKGGQTLPPIRHTNTPVDRTAGPNSKDWRYRNPSGEPDNNETMETRNGTPDSCQNNTQTNRKEFLYSKKVPPENTCVDERPLKMPIDSGLASELSLVVKAGDKPIKVGQKENSTYEKRKMYGKNLEKNWFSEHIQKKHVSPREEIGDISDLFYSPCYTESEGESNAEDVRQVTDKKRHPIEANSDLFSSTDVLMGEEGELEESTASEYEIIIKDNVLMEKKTKHKMRKKRQRKRDRYLKLVEDQTTTDPDISHLTDTQLRAMRLKLAKRHVQPRLKGKRKFLQVANAVFAAMQFAKILKKLRKAKKLKRKSLRKSKKVLKQGSEDAYDEFERKSTPFSLKTEFLKTIGDKLIRDVSNLNIKDKDDTCETTDGTKTLTHLDTSIEDLLANVSEGPQPHRLAYRRGSDPTSLARPKLFPIEVYETTKVRRRDLSKHVATPKSSINRSLSCDRNRKCTCPRGRSNANGHNKSARCAVHGIYRGFKVKETIIMFDRDEVLKQRRPSLDMDKIKSGEAIDLRDLLAGIDIPAKEIKIQIALRKMRRRKLRQSNRPDTVHQTAVVQRPRFNFDEVIIPPKKSSQKTLHCERTQERLQTEEKNEVKDELNNVSLSYPTDDDPPYDGSPEQPNSAYDGSDDTKCSLNATTLEPIKSHVKSRNASYSFSSPVKPIMSYGGLSWDPTTAPARPRYSDKEIAEEMERVSSLMLQMKDCRYIRWTPFHQAVIARMEKNNYQNTVC